MYFDRFDILQAHYWFCSDWYDGQRDPLYARLCRILKHFTPGCLSRGPDSENAQAIYDNLVEKFRANKRAA
jgi:hypothetical protein